jgi:hypothetical protein
MLAVYLRNLILKYVEYHKCKDTVVEPKHSLLRAYDLHSVSPLRESGIFFAVASGTKATHSENLFLNEHLSVVAA